MSISAKLKEIAAEIEKLESKQVDHELEEAKKRFPVESWFTYEYCNSTLFKVVSVERDSEMGIVILDDAGNVNCLRLCTPATLPTRKINWRCMKTDAPDTMRDVLIQLDYFYFKGWYHHDGGWRGYGVSLDLSEYATALWCELSEIEGK